MSSGQQSQSVYYGTLMSQAVPLKGDSVMFGKGFVFCPWRVPVRITLLKPLTGHPETNKNFNILNLLNHRTPFLLMPVNPPGTAGFTRTSPRLTLPYHCILSLWTDKGRNNLYRIPGTNSHHLWESHNLFPWAQSECLSLQYSSPPFLILLWTSDAQQPPHKNRRSAEDRGSAAWGKVASAQ